MANSTLAPDPTAPTVAKLPAGPKISPIASLTYRFSRDPLNFLERIARTYGDLASYRMTGELLFFVNHPQYIKDILVTGSRNFTKSRGLEMTKKLLGNGLLTSEGALHLRQRRLKQPAFHRDRIAAYAKTMVDYADELRRQWRDNTTLDVSQEMMRVTLSIAGKTLFDVDVESQAREVGRALTDVMASFWLSMMPFADVIERLPVGPMRRARDARERLDAIIYGMIAERRANHRGDNVRGDLLSMLFVAQDEDHGSTMTDRQIRDEAMTIFLAGHETTANALTWTWYLVSQAPDVERRVYEEIQRVLGDRLPTVADVERLPCITRVVTESMRLYPPAWLVGRRAVNEYRIGDYSVPPRSIIVMSQWIVHRDGRHYSDPLRFDPDRWTPEFKATLPRFAYFPFGGGPRQCIGESFAWMELVLLAATIAQQWRFELVPGHPVVPHAAVTLRPKHGMKMIARRR